MREIATPTTVLYDGSCPICSREINQYKKGDPLAQICWIDVSSATFVAPPGHSKEKLMARFHVIASNGEVVSGAAAFVQLWQQLPGWKYIALLARLPGVLNLMEFGYEKFLRFRPKIQKIFS
jgi:predicted DCC family thiol-disulfide oxidoreductase YuxK